MGLLKGAIYTDRINVNDPNVFLMRFKEANGNYFIAAWSEWGNTDWQVMLKLPITANPAVNVTAIGHGTMQTSFSTSADNPTIPSLSVIIRRNPVIIEGPGVQSATYWRIGKLEFPETTRTVTQPVAYPPNPAYPPDGPGGNGGP